MRSFAYLRDPLFGFCVALYFLNRLVLKPFVPNTFSICYLNDLICIPFWLPIMLFLMRRLRVRGHDLPPEPHEILVALLVWSFAFECVVPYTERFRHVAVGDPVDIAWYVAGALAATLFWRFWYREKWWQAGSLPAGQSDAQG